MDISELPHAYTRFGAVVHLLPEDASLNKNLDGALCGIWPDYWLGSGSYAEQERAANLPVCKRCLLYLPDGVDHPESVSA